MFPVWGKTGTYRPLTSLKYSLSVNKQPRMAEIHTCGFFMYAPENKQL
jgi:hypothetical protein